MEQEKEGRFGAVVLPGRPTSISARSKSVRQEDVSDVRVPGRSGLGASQNKPAQVRILGEVGDPAPDIVAVDFHNVARFVGGAERDFVKYALHHGLQPSRPDVLDG